MKRRLAAEPSFLFFLFFLFFLSSSSFKTGTNPLPQFRTSGMPETACDFYPSDPRNPFPILLTVSLRTSRTDDKTTGETQTRISRNSAGIIRSLAERVRNRPPVRDFPEIPAKPGLTSSTIFPLHPHPGIFVVYFSCHVSPLRYYSVRRLSFRSAGFGTPLRLWKTGIFRNTAVYHEENLQNNHPAFYSGNPHPGFRSGVRTSQQHRSGDRCQQKI